MKSSSSLSSSYLSPSSKRARVIHPSPLDNEQQQNLAHSSLPSSSPSATPSSPSTTGLLQGLMDPPQEIPSSTATTNLQSTTKNSYKSAFAANHATLNQIHSILQCQEQEEQCQEHEQEEQQQEENGETVSILSLPNETILPILDPVNRTTSVNHSHENHNTYLEHSNVNSIPPHSHKEEEEQEEDDFVEITHSNVTNPTIAYPHPRHLCGIFPFYISSTDDPTPNLILSYEEANQKYCAKCFCYVCDTTVPECQEWKNGPYGHCHATAGNPIWEKKRMERKQKSQSKVVITIDEDEYESETEKDDGSDAYDQSTVKSQSTVCSTSDEHENQYQDPSPSTFMNVVNHLMEQGIVSLETKHLLLNSPGTDKNQDRAGKNTIPSSVPRNYYKDHSKMSITEVLSYNLQQTMRLSTTEDSKNRKVEGDIPRLNLNNNFFVEGIQIGWPYSKIMMPQRQIASHLIKAFKSAKHVVVESPTGTGKSAAILCTALAWQRSHAAKMSSSKKTFVPEFESQESLSSFSQHYSLSGDDSMTCSDSYPRIIYCSRTHSQVAQMISTLQRTAYRPKMAVLGSRDRLCINGDLRPKRGNSKSFHTININQECRERVRNTEKFRRSNRGSDDHTPSNISFTDITSENTGDLDLLSTLEDDETASPQLNNDNQALSSNSKTCSHYRQLTRSDVADMATEMFIPSNPIRRCKNGGAESKVGTHDIEDLVNFGKNPFVHRGIAVYRLSSSESSFGLMLEQHGGNVRIHKIQDNMAAAENGSLRTGDVIIAVNGSSIMGLSFSQVTNQIKASTDPLLLDVYRGDGDPYEEYSPHSVCPYYLSQALSKDAELIFAPYNYILDPKIRSSLSIDIEGAIICLDEAHNVEDTLKEVGSGSFTELDLMEIVVMLSRFSVMQRQSSTQIDVRVNGQSEEEIYLPDISHSLLVFVEKVLTVLLEEKNRFCRGSTSMGEVKAIQEYRKFKLPDDHEFEVAYCGPGISGGCFPFLDKICGPTIDVKRLCHDLDLFEKNFRSGNDYTSLQLNSNFDKMKELVSLLYEASQQAEHYYVAVIIQANGNMKYAVGDVEEQSNYSGWRRPNMPRAYPQIKPAHQGQHLPLCTNSTCRVNSDPIRGDKVSVCHGSYCDGSVPKWIVSFKLKLLNPGILFRPIAAKARSVVLASGSLAPVMSLCAELDLLPSSPRHDARPVDLAAMDDVNNTHDDCSVDVMQSRAYRLQTIPKPLEANHIIDLPKQLLALSIGEFSDGVQLTVTQSNYSKPGFLPKLGAAIASIIEAVPSGGILVFLPSYSLLKKCVNAWGGNDEQESVPFWPSRGDCDSSIWDRFQTSKGTVVIEPSGSQKGFEQARDEYTHAIETSGSAMLLAVFRGKMSEGISFNDDFARAVVCVGLPFPNVFDRAVKAKQKYNDEQRKMRQRSALLDGQSWYLQQAYRAVAQALGRCIRHAADYGVIVLLDSRYCDDGSSRHSEDVACAHRNLPKWIRKAIVPFDSVGRWQGLHLSFLKFFDEAKSFCNAPKVPCSSNFGQLLAEVVSTLDDLRIDCS